MNNVGRVLAIDYGKTRIGIAISDSYNTLAMPLKIIRNTSIENNSIELEHLVEKYHIDRLLVGRPLDREGNETLMSKEVESFIEGVNTYLTGKKIKLDIIFWDESYTSKLSLMNLKEKGKNAKAAKSLVDMEAAAMILQEYLDNK